MVTTMLRGLAASIRFAPGSTRACAAAASVAVCVSAAAHAQVYTNATPISIPDVGQAIPNPSVITVIGGPAVVGSITVTLHDVTHGASGRCLVQLQAPNGQIVTLAAGNTAALSNTSHIELAFGQAQVASTTVPPVWATGTYLPSSGWGSIPGSNGNGTWRLGILQNLQQAGIGGQVAGGWSLSLGADKGLINVDFNNSSSPTHVGAGLIGQQGDTWNGVVGHSGQQSLLPMRTSYNAPSAISLQYGDFTNAFASGNNHSFNGTPFANLMSDYMYVASGNTGTCTLRGLTPNAPYDVILYSNPDLNSIRTTRFTINGESKVAASQGTAGTFIPGVNYIRFPSTAADQGGAMAISVTALPSGTGLDEAEFNGLQIQPAPLTVAGESCSQPTLVGNGTTFFSTVGATTDGPSENGVGFDSDTQVNQDVWFLYTASCSGTATVDLCGSSFDTKVAIYGAGGACPTGPNTAIAGNDNAACNMTTLSSRVSFGAIAGHQYLVRVGGHLTATGAVRMNISCDGSACLVADVGAQGGLAGRDGQLDNNDFIAFIDAFFNHTGCP